MEYSWLVAEVRKNNITNDEDGFRNAVDQAITNMPNSFVIKQFLIAHRAEVMGMLYEEYNEAETMELFKKDGIEEKARKVAINGYRMGLSIETIAEMVEVPVDVVLKWIADTEDEPVAA